MHVYTDEKTVVQCRGRITFQSRAGSRRCFGPAQDRAHRTEVGRRRGHSVASGSPRPLWNGSSLVLLRLHSHLTPRSSLPSVTIKLFHAFSMELRAQIQSGNSKALCVALLVSAVGAAGFLSYLNGRPGLGRRQRRPRAVTCAYGTILVD